MALPGDLPSPRFEPSGQDDPLALPSARPRPRPRPRAGKPSAAPAPRPAAPASPVRPSTPPAAVPPPSAPITDPPFVLKRYVRPAPSPIDPLIEALPESVQQGLESAGDVVESAASETLAYATKNKRVTAGIALGILVVGAILTSINRRNHRIKLGETALF